MLAVTIMDLLIMVDLRVEEHTLRIWRYMFNILNGRAQVVISSPTLVRLKIQSDKVQVQELIHKDVLKINTHLEVLV